MMNLIVSVCSKLAQKEVQDKARLGGNGDSLEIVLDIEFWPFYQMVYAQTVLENGTHKILWDFKIQTDHLILSRRPDQVLINQKKKKKKTNKKNKNKKKQNKKTNKQDLPSSGVCRSGGPQREIKKKTPPPQKKR